MAPSRGQEAAASFFEGADAYRLYHAPSFVTSTWSSSEIAHRGHGRYHARHASGNRAVLIEDHAGMHVVLAQPRRGIVGQGL